MVEVVVVSNDVFFVPGMPARGLCPSVVSMVKFHFLHSDHLVSENTLFLGVETSSRTEVSAGLRLVFRDALLSEVLTLVVGLVLVVFLNVWGHASSLGQAPSGEVRLG